MFKLLHDLRRNEKGASLIEYGMLVGLIAVVCIVAVTTLGTQISAVFSLVASDMQNI
jgi:pilus assembly protein Flp/PilA